MSRTRPTINIHPRTLLPSSSPNTTTTTSTASSTTTTTLLPTYDAIILGAGPTGETCATILAAAGLSTLLVESELVGGECPYWACVPSKALLRPGEVVEVAGMVHGAREMVKSGEGVHVDVAAVWDRRDEFAKGWNDEGNVKMMQGAGVSVVHGFGAVVGEKRVSVKSWYGEGETVEVQARVAAVVATGSEPMVPRIEGLEEAGYWTPREAVSAREVPRKLIVLGGGAVGVEMATAYRDFGSDVVLISTGRVLGKAVAEASRRVEEGLKRSGVDVRAGSKVKSVERENGEVRVVLADGAVITGSEILVATGRRARTVGMGLEKVGAPSDGAWVDVDESICAKSVSGGWLYAAGDTNGIAPTTHMGRYQAIIAANSIISKYKGTYDGQVGDAFTRLSRKPAVDAVPQVVFSDPQVAWVGLSAKQAQAKGLKVREVSTKMQGPGTFLHAEGYDGWAQWVVEDAGRIVGATFVGREVADLLHASTVAVVTGLTWMQMFHAVPSFPTVSEVYHNLVEACAASEK